MRTGCVRTGEKCVQGASGREKSAYRVRQDGRKVRTGCVRTGEKCVQGALGREKSAYRVRQDG